MMDRLIQRNSTKEATTASSREIRQQYESPYNGVPRCSRSPTVATLNTVRYLPDILGKLRVVTGVSLFFWQPLRMLRETVAVIRLSRKKVPLADLLILTLIFTLQFTLYVLHLWAGPKKVISLQRLKKEKLNPKNFLRLIFLYNFFFSQQIDSMYTR